jgi:CheY-like chemotaxis protein
MKTILLVEDSPNLGDLYQEELGEAGYHTLRACNGQEALQQMMQHRPDLVVLDINMPCMDGLEVMERMLAAQPGVPIIINSGYAGYQDNFRCWSAEAFVSKSSDLTELKSQIHRVLDLQAFQEFQESKRSA